MEAEFAEKVVARLSKYFRVQDERWSKDRKYRVDFVINELENKDAYFGIEFKDFDTKTGEKIGEHILQSLKYTQAEFEIEPKTFRKIPILVCPPISYTYLMCPMPNSKTVMKSKVFPRDMEFFHDRHPKDSIHHTMNGLLGVFNIGEIRTTTQKRFGKEYQRIWFLFSNRVIWSERKKWDYITRTFKEDEIEGLHHKNYDRLINDVKNFKIFS